MFTGSPVKSDKKILEVIGKKLKKNNVALDIVDLGGTRNLPCLNS
jgi:26S proteasome regulatory subunit N10